MKTQIIVENLKCNGCATTIRKELSQMEGVSSVQVEVETGQVNIDHADVLLPETIKDKLMHLGYPEMGSLHGISKVAANAKSFVSCAVGRMS